MRMLTVVSFLSQSEGAAESVPTPLRLAVRILLGILIALLLGYIAIEQIGTWKRRRSGRD